MANGQLRGMGTRNEGVFAIRSLFVMPKLLDGGIGAGPKGQDDGVKHCHSLYIACSLQDCRIYCFLRYNLALSSPTRFQNA